MGSLKLHQNEVMALDGECKTREARCVEADKAPSEHASLVSLNDADDEFFDVPEPSEYDQLEDEWSYDFGPEMHSQVIVNISNLFLLLVIR